MKALLLLLALFTSTAAFASEWVSVSNGQTRVSREYNQHFALPEDDYEDLVMDYESLCAQFGHSTSYPKQIRLAYKFEHTFLGLDSKGWKKGRVTCDVMWIPRPQSCVK
jgi:hypothetical protein